MWFGLLITLLAVTSASGSMSQSVVAAGELWQDVPPGAVQAAGGMVSTLTGEQPWRYRLLTADLAAIDAILAQAPMEGSVSGAAAPAVISLPLPGGGNEQFVLQEYAMLTPDFAAARPDIRTYLGTSVTNPLRIVRLTRTSSGLHSMVQFGGAISYIDPQPSGLYIAYDQRDLPPSPFTDAHLPGAASGLVSAAGVTVSGDKRHIYRLAMAATGEFTMEAGGKIAAQDKIAAFVNDMNGIYERDLSVRFTLLNNDKYVYTNPNTDPYTDSNANALIDQNRSNLDNPAVLGNANYDIGYVLRLGGGGVAFLGGLCNAALKGGGTGSIGTVSLHELAHLLGGNHTFNASSPAAENCNGGNYAAEAAYEPGSGSTLLAYSGGICGPQNLQGFQVDRYFHSISIREMNTYINGPGLTCGIHQDTGNTAPTVAAGPDRQIPARTAFILQGQATDANGDPLTFTWEQFDRGTAWTQANVLPNTDLGNNPIFRSFPPAAVSPNGQAQRILPALNNPFSALGESLPTTNRTLTFRLTARDGKGGVNADDVTLQVINTAGPFVITTPGLGALWAPGSQQTVNWNVAGTNQPPFNCASLDVAMSTDIGQSFFNVATGVPNTGSTTVTAPNIVGSAILRLQCSNPDQIFAAFSPPPGVRLCSAILNDNHEGAATNWTTSVEDGSTPWARQNNGGFSGQNYWSVPSSSFSSSYLESGPLVASNNGARLTFVHRYSIGFDANNPESNQAALVQVKVGAGAWQDLASFASSSANYPIWVEANYELGNLVKQGDTFQLRFWLNRRGWSWGNDGWAVDDVLVCGGVTQAPATATPTATVPPASTPTHTPTATPTTPPDATATPTPTPVPPSAFNQAVWTGGGDDNRWHNASNWDTQTVPNGGTDVRIPGGLAKYPTINTDAAVRNLTIENDAQLEMLDGQFVVFGDWGEAAGTTDAVQEYCRDFTNTVDESGQPKLFGPSLISDTLVIPEGSKLTDLDLLLDVRHEWVGDIVATLRHQASGIQVTVLDPEDGCDGDNLALTLDDEASEAAATSCVSGANPAYPGTRYRPNEALSAFDNRAFAGAWTLTLDDIYPSADNGELRRWCLNISTASAAGRFVGSGGTVIFADSSSQTLRTGSASSFPGLTIINSAQVRLASDLDVNGGLIIGSNAQLAAGSFTIKLAGNWGQLPASSFLPETGAVILDGTEVQFALGTLRFNDLTINPGARLDLGSSELFVAGQLVNRGTIRQTLTVNGAADVPFVRTGNFGGLLLNANGADLGNTTVTFRYSDTGCVARLGDTIQRCFTIEPTNSTGRNASIRFFYRKSELLSHSCNNLNAYQDNASGNELPALSRAGVTCSGSVRSITVQNVSNFNPANFVLGVGVGSGLPRADEPPVATTDEITTTVAAAITIPVLENDFDPEGDVFTLDAVSSPAHGTAELDGRGRIIYTPTAGYVGQDSFTYDISDDASSATGTVNVTIIAAAAEDLYLPVISAR
jgi:hypothetical protein